MISGIIKVDRQVTVISLGLLLSESNNCFIIHCFEEEKKGQTQYRMEHNVTLLLEITCMHCERKVQISH